MFSAKHSPEYICAAEEYIKEIEKLQEKLIECKHEKMFSAKYVDHLVSELDAIIAIVREDIRS